MSFESDSPYLVHIVVDPVFGERLASLPPRQPVWIVDSPQNTPVVHRLWRERPGESHLEGVTTFKPGRNQSAEGGLMGILDTVDLHHGEYSADPPYSLLDVVGCCATEEVRAVLKEIGFFVAELTKDGFRACKRDA